MAAAQDAKDKVIICLQYIEYNLNDFTCVLCHNE